MRCESGVGPSLHRAIGARALQQSLAFADRDVPQLQGRTFGDGRVRVYEAVSLFQERRGVDASVLLEADVYHNCAAKCRRRVHIALDQRDFRGDDGDALHHALHRRVRDAAWHARCVRRGAVLRHCAMGSAAAMRKLLLLLALQVLRQAVRPIRNLGIGILRFQPERQIDVTMGQVRQYGHGAKHAHFDLQYIK
jgi:hypothetical protein